MNRYIVLFGLLILYVLLINSPLIIAWSSHLPARPFRDELASGLAMIGMVMIMLEFVLSGRFKSISAPIGIDIIMRSHQLLGRVIIIFLFLHPMLYSLPSNRVLPWDTYLAHTTRLDMIDAVTGMLAWIGLALIVFMALMREALQSNYELWRRSHLFLSISTTVLALIHAVGAGRYTEFTSVDIIWLGLALLAILALIHVYLTVPLQQRSRPYLIESISAVANKSWRLVLTPARGEVLDYMAGQFVWLKFSGPFLSMQEHPFSISSHPGNRSSLEFTIKEFGDFSSRLDELKIGSKVYIDGPHGSFSVNNRLASGMMLIAGGAGIAPIISILRQLADEGYEYPVVLITCNNTPSDLAYRNEIDDLSSRLNIRSIHMASRGGENSDCLKGRLSHQIIVEQMPEKPDRWCYFVCGPAGMMDTAEYSLLQLGVPLKQIVTERFRYDALSSSRRSRYILYSVIAVLSISGLILLGFSLHLYY
ncbi:MAG: ferric reductase-like transmembrane domain-containing protein [Gammaproteobacteria bacterium]|nr:ferric reductase-like transmembrane domain-containing protein [Gammaproteobacteria bacterium]